MTVRVFKEGLEVCVAREGIRKGGVAHGERRSRGEEDKESAGRAVTYKRRLFLCIVAVVDVTYSSDPAII